MPGLGTHAESSRAIIGITVSSEGLGTIEIQVGQMSARRCLQTGTGPKRPGLLSRAVYAMTLAWPGVQHREGELGHIAKCSGKVGVWTSRLV